MKANEILIELRKLDEQLQALQSKKEITPDDVTKMEGIVKQMGELHQMREALIKVEEMRIKTAQPVDEPAGRGQPTDGRPKFGSFGEYLQAVAAAGLPRGGRLGTFQTGVIDRRLLYEDVEIRSTGLEEATPSLGGFLVQKDFSTEIWKKTHDTSILFSRVRQIPVSGNANGLKMNYIDETSRVAGSRWGGIRGYWLGEGGAKTASKPKFGQIELSLKKLIGLCYATDELLQDAAALETVIRDGFAEEISFKIDDSILNGTGAGQPLGIINAGCLISVAKETGQTAATIVWENIKKMYARLWARSRPNMLWVTNQDCLPQLMSMSQPVGTGGIPVWIAGNSATNQPNDLLLGRPVVYHEGCQTIGTAGDIYLIDPTQYLMITKGGVQSASSIHVQFTTDETTFRFVYRVDGQPLWQSALTPFKGSNTQSPFINLAVRS